MVPINVVPDTGIVTAIPSEFIDNDSQTLSSDSDAGAKVISSRQERSKTAHKLTLDLFREAHRRFDALERDKLASVRLGLGLSSKLSIRPFDLDGGSWEGCFDPNDERSAMAKDVLAAVSRLLAQLSKMKMETEAGGIDLIHPIDMRWIVAMYDDASRTWDNLTWLESIHKPLPLDSHNYYYSPKSQAVSQQTTRGRRGRQESAYESVTEASDSSSAADIDAVTQTDDDSGLENTPIPTLLEDSDEDFGFPTPPASLRLKLAKFTMNRDSGKKTTRVLENIFEPLPVPFEQLPVPRVINSLSRPGKNVHDVPWASRAMKAFFGKKANVQEEDINTLISRATGKILAQDMRHMDAFDRAFPWAN